MWPDNLFCGWARCQSGVVPEPDGVACVNPSNRSLPWSLQIIRNHSKTMSVRTHAVRLCVRVCAYALMNYICVICVLACTSTFAYSLIHAFT